MKGHEYKTEKKWDNIPKRTTSTPIQQPRVNTSLMEAMSTRQHPQLLSLLKVLLANRALHLPRPDSRKLWLAVIHCSRWRGSQRRGGLGNGIGFVDGEWSLLSHLRGTGGRRGKSALGDGSCHLEVSGLAVEDGVVVLLDVSGDVKVDDWDGV